MWPKWCLTRPDCHGDGFAFPVEADGKVYYVYLRRAGLLGYDGYPYRIGRDGKAVDLRGCTYEYLRHLAYKGDLLVYTDWRDGSFESMLDE